MDFLVELIRRVTTDMNRELTKDFIEAEVFEALQQMHPHKAPGPDGMALIFFQRYWHIVGKSVTTTILQALNGGMFPSSLNHIFITLIPKKKKKKA